MELLYLLKTLFTKIYNNLYKLFSSKLMIFNNPHNFDDFTNRCTLKNLKKLQHFSAQNLLWKRRQLLPAPSNSFSRYFCSLSWFALDSINWACQGRNQLNFYRGSSFAILTQMFHQKHTTLSITALKLMMSCILVKAHFSVQPSLTCQQYSTQLITFSSKHNLYLTFRTPLVFLPSWPFLLVSSLVAPRNLVLFYLCQLPR